MLNGTLLPDEHQSLLTHETPVPEWLNDLFNKLNASPRTKTALKTLELLILAGGCVTGAIGTKKIIEELFGKLLRECGVMDPLPPETLGYIVAVVSALINFCIFKCASADVFHKRERLAQFITRWILCSLFALFNACASALLTYEQFNNWLKWLFSVLNGLTNMPFGADNVLQMIDYLKTSATYWGKASWKQRTVLMGAYLGASALAITVLIGAGGPIFDKPVHELNKAWHGYLIGGIAISLSQFVEYLFQLRQMIFMDRNLGIMLKRHFTNGESTSRIVWTILGAGIGGLSIPGFTYTQLQAWEAPLWALIVLTIGALISGTVSNISSVNEFVIPIIIVWFKKFIEFCIKCYNVSCDFICSLPHKLCGCLQSCYHECNGYEKFDSV